MYKKIALITTLLVSFFLAGVAGADVDSDGDGFPNSSDNCPYKYNPNQADVDQDHIGDVCDPDGCPEETDVWWHYTDNCGCIPLNYYQGRPYDFLSADANSSIPIERHAAEIVSAYQLYAQINSNTGKPAIWGSREDTDGNWFGAYWYRSQVDTDAWYILNRFQGGFYRVPNGDIRNRSTHEYLLQLGGTDQNGHCGGVSNPPTCEDGDTCCEYGEDCDDPHPTPTPTPDPSPYPSPTPEPEPECELYVLKRRADGDKKRLGAGKQLLRTKTEPTEYGLDLPYFKELFDRTTYVDEVKGDPVRDGVADTGWIRYDNIGSRDVHVRGIEKALTHLMRDVRTRLCNEFRAQGISRRQIPDICQVIFKRRDKVQRSFYTRYDFYFREDGEPVLYPTQEQQDEACMVAEVEECIDLRTPISLLWNSDLKLSDVPVSYVNFPINQEASDAWYEWKGSADTPLIVFDPTHAGEITSARQLFGSWTFGGEKTAGVATDISPQLPMPWANGYLPLATLDLNRNDMVEGEELKPLGLWFDQNKDGISQPGEVKTMQEAGVTKLFFRNVQKDKISGEFIAEIGFERIKNGKVETGKSFDWITAGASTKEDLIKLR